jgi:DNA-binding transcriptional LysR family regulator
MNNVQQILVFVRAARHASFAKAARELGQSASTVAKSIARLEAQWGVKLFYRTTRRVSLTPDGQSLFERCQRILDEVEALRAEAEGVRGEPTGVLRIDVPLTYGKRVVLPLLAALTARHPGLSLDVRLSDRYADIIAEGLDAVVRIGPLADSRLIARRVGWQHLVVCASPAYLDARGVPQTPDELEHHDCVLFRLPTTERERPWQFRVDDLEVEIHPKSRARLNDGEALVEAACADMGLVQVPDYMAGDAIAAVKVVEVLREFRAPPLPINVVYPSNRMLPPRVRAFVDALACAAPLRSADPAEAPSTSRVPMPNST